MNRVAALLLLVVLVTLGIVSTGVEYVDVEEAGQGSAQARANPYLALELWLGRLGVPTRTRFGLSALPEHGVVLLLTEDPDQREAVAPDLQAWVFDGGHLLTCVAGPPVDPGWFAPQALPDQAAADVLLAGLDVVVGQGDGAPTPRTLTDGVGTWRAALPPLPVLAVKPGYEADKDRLLRAEGAVVGLSHPYGDGRVTVLNTPSLLAETMIADEDHAALLWSLLTPGGAPPAEALIVMSGGGPSLLTLLWRHGAAAILSLGGVLIVTVWHAGVRQGPRREDEVPVRRSLGEHIAATGRLLWSANHAETLLAPLRAAVRRRLARRFPEAPSEAARFGAAAAQLGVEPTVVRAALDETPWTDPEGLLRHVTTLQALWRLR